ncbi:LacI family DNA-binding transcriptional regulator, partial [Verminephrobacter eiseniae]
MNDTDKRQIRRRFGTNSVTMADVARVAGVSAQTVSRVLREPDGCSPQTVERVREAIRSTQYVQNHAASHLASNRSMTVAAVIPQIAASIFAETLQGLSNVLLQAGYQVIIGHTDYSHEREEAVVRNLLGRRPDAFFLVGTHHTDAVRDMLVRAAIPVVESWAWTDAPIDQLVGFSNQAALAEAVAYA